MIQRCQIGGAGDVASHGAGEVIQTQCHAVLGNGSAQNGDGVGSSLCSLQSRGSICHNQCHAGGNKAVGNGGAGSGIALCILEVESDVLAKGSGQRILKALRSGIQCSVLHQLADANGEFFSV